MKYKKSAEQNAIKRPPRHILVFLYQNYIVDFRTGRIMSRITKKLVGSKSNGCPINDGYRRIFARGFTLKYHHVSFFLHHKRWPRTQLDHKDGRKLNNAPWNLEEVTEEENRRRKLERIRKLKAKNDKIV